MKSNKIEIANDNLAHNIDILSPYLPKKCNINSLLNSNNPFIKAVIERLKSVKLNRESVEERFELYNLMNQRYSRKEDDEYERVQ